MSSATILPAYKPSLNRRSPEPRESRVNARRNWLLLISYDGACYRGWQVQPNHHTIEGALESALQRLTGESVKVFGAGRTDSGVHALNQTASFVSSKPFSPEKWRVSLNAVLPEDIVVKHVQPVPDDFHARHSAVGKRYRYQICNLPYHPPFARKTSWWVRFPLDIEAMREAASHFVGEHDFSAFRAAQCSSPNPVKELREFNINEDRTQKAFLQVEMEANSFLQHMVRILVGTLVEVGLGKLKPEEMDSILKSRDRSLAGQTAPAHGLCVLRVIYPEATVSWPAEVMDR